MTARDEAQLITDRSLHGVSFQDSGGQRIDPAHVSQRRGVAEEAIEKAAKDVVQDIEFVEALLGHPIIRRQA